MAKKKSKKKEKTLLAKFGWRCFGLVLVLLSVLLIVSSFFFHADDVSFNTASGQVQNTFGRLGSLSADFVLSWFGWALPLFLLAPIVWGCHLLRLKEIVHPYSRLFAFALGTLCLSVLLSILPQSWGLVNAGGAIGIFFARHLLTLFNSIYVYAYGKHVFALILSILILLSFDFALGITYKNWLSWFKAIVNAISGFAAFIARGGKVIARFGSRGEDGETSSKRVVKAKAPKERKEPKLKDEPVAKENTETVKMSGRMSAAKNKEVDDGYQKPSVNLLSMVKDKNAGQVNEKELESIALDLENFSLEYCRPIMYC